MRKIVHLFQIDFVLLNDNSDAFVENWYLNDLNSGSDALFEEYLFNDLLEVVLFEHISLDKVDLNELDLPENNHHFEEFGVLMNNK
jgi:hypothetical protein